MGVYAQTHFEVECKDNGTAKEVASVLKKMKEDEYGNTFAEEIVADGNMIYGFMSSGRIQNLEYRCGKVWEAIKDSKGTLSANFPFLSEADGVYYSND